MNQFKFIKNRRGLTLIEILIYAVIFSVIAIFLVNILTSVTRIQVQQASQNELNQQISFVANTIQRMVRDSSLIENDAGVSSSTLVLRMASSSLDKTRIYWDTTSSAIFMVQGNGSPTALTNDKVTVVNFSVTKYDNQGGLAVVQVDLTLSFNTSNPQAKAVRRWQSAISRISAATFDTSILPSGSGLDIGGVSSQWQKGYFSSDVQIGGNLGIGISPSAVSTVKVRSAGDIVVTTSTYGLVLTKPDGNCVRITINSSGNIATSSPYVCP